MCPLTVRAWPDSTDPRGPHFLVGGFDHGQVAAERYLLTTTDAVAPYEDLNTGVLVVFDSQIGAEVWKFVDDSGDYVLTVFSTDTPIGAPEFSVQWLLQITKPGEPRYDVEIKELFQTAIAVRSAPAVAVPPNGDKIPNDVTFTPENHLFEL